MNQIATPMYKQWQWIQQLLLQFAILLFLSLNLYGGILVNKKHQAKQNINLMTYLSSIISTCKCM